MPPTYAPGGTAPLPASTTSAPFPPAVPVPTVKPVPAMVQRSANGYQPSAHPEFGTVPTGMTGRYTWGEVVALVIGAVITLLLIAADLLP